MLAKEQTSLNSIKSHVVVEGRASRWRHDRHQWLQVRVRTRTDHIKYVYVL